MSHVPENVFLNSKSGINGYLSEFPLVKFAVVISIELVERIGKVTVNFCAREDRCDINAKNVTEKVVHLVTDVALDLIKTFSEKFISLLSLTDRPLSFCQRFS